MLSLSIIIRRHPERSPAQAPGLQSLFRRIHTRHAEFPKSLIALAPLVGISRPARSPAKQSFPDLERHERRISIGPQADRIRRDEALLHDRIAACAPSLPDGQRRLPDIDVTGVTELRAMRTLAANQLITPRLCRLNRIFGFDQDPDLKHRPGLTVRRLRPKTGHHHHALVVFVDDHSSTIRPKS